MGYANIEQLASGVHKTGWILMIFIFILISLSPCSYVIWMLMTHMDGITNVVPF
ncbi:hypothetical protein Lalb_Chr03g0042191 [Lupinus albus]|uniref:Uncharacterized protein n=1 Tax=Lupinus albus TaxID=3870 RepID=A0A6A4QX75_LUPAL|nr:hypothetical protein Lalb_Chr03g0042191 [Lupinus albus]